MDNSVALLIGGVIGTTILLALGASAGFWVGLHVAGHAVAERSPQPSEVAQPPAWLAGLERCLEASQRSHEQSEVVALLARSSKIPLPAELVKAIQRMVETTHELASELRHLPSGGAADPSINGRKRAASVEPKANTSRDLSGSLRLVEDATGGDTTLTTEEMCNVIGGRQRMSDTALDLESKRYPYDCPQQLAAWPDDEPPPQPHQFLSVRCHDLSVSGISFFWPDPPQFTRAVISIGAGEKQVFMVVEVCDHKAVFMHEKVAFLVGCRFISRLDEASAVSRQPAVALA